jgi:gas vesicle protein
VLDSGGERFAADRALPREQQGVFKMERQNVMSVASAFALGSLAGAAVALLYAPRSGGETRQMMRDKMRRGAELGREKLREGAEYTREKIEQGRQIAQNAVGRGEEIAASTAEYAESVAEGAGFGERRRKARVSSELQQQ